jgi:hypothetical protein
LFGAVDAGFVRYQPWMVQVAHQTHGFPGNPQAAFGFRADGNKIKVLSQCPGNVTVVFVSAVKANLFSQQTFTDTYFNFSRHLST